MIDSWPRSFSTARLSAEPVSFAVLADLAAMNEDPQVMTWLGGVGTLAQTRAWIAAQEAEWREHGFGLWVIRESGGLFVGRAGLQVVPGDVGAAISDAGAVELLYALVPAAWGHGYATEIGAALLRVAFTHLGLASVVAYTLPHNGRSRHVLEKLGMTYERDLVHDHQPHVLYRSRAPSRPLLA